MGQGLLFAEIIDYLRPRHTISLVGRLKRPCRAMPCSMRCDMPRHTSSMPVPTTRPSCQTPPSALLGLGLLPLGPHRLPPHEVAREREQRRVERDPHEQHPEVESDARVQVEERAPGRFDDVVQRPRVAPVVPLRRQVEGVKGRRDVGDDPEDEPHGRPRLPDGHRDVLAREAEGDHADEVDHPVDDEGAFAVRVGVVGDRGAGGGGVREGDLEGEGDEGVGEGHEEVGQHGADPADEDELPEFDGRVASGRDEPGVDG